MKTRCPKNIIPNIAAASLIFIWLFMLTGIGMAQQPQTTFRLPANKRGQDAIDALQERLPRFASRYGKKAEKLKEVFLKDQDLWLDRAENLLYLCTFDASDTELPAESEVPAIPTGPFPLEQTFKLHSLAGASRIVYLDFDGHVTAGTIWNNNFNNGDNIISAPYDINGNGSFTDAELNRIQNIWARVAEDFAIYNIDVTTEDPGMEALRRSDRSDENYGIRVVISPSSSWYGNAGGVAYVGSFDWNSDTPTFVFSNKLGNGNEKYVTEAISHEVGHTLGLVHDGVSGGSAYYSGHGDWAPIMGVGYYKPITQWSKGEYAGANNTEDDLAVMLTNGASYRPDDHGNWIENATVLDGEFLDASGLIERTGDIDIFRFQTQAGDVSINVDPANLAPNLDIFMQILDDGGNVVGGDDPFYVLPAGININLPAGTYYLLIDGVGTGDPDSGYSDYASLGQYFISGQLPATQLPPDAPSGLAAMEISTSRINLSWTDNSTNENGFTIERSLNGTDSWAEVGYAGSNITTFSDTGLSPETTFHYRVSAYNVVGSSGYTNTANATTLGQSPAPPSNLSALAVSPEQINLGWDDNSDNENGFTVERSPDGAGSWAEIGFSDANNPVYSDMGLVPGTTYHYRVSAYNTNGSSAYSSSAQATTDEQLPDAPAGLTAAAVNTDRIDLNWLDNSNNEDGFIVERSAGGPDSWQEIYRTAANSTGYSDTGLEPGATYFYRIAAFNDVGSSVFSNTVEANTGEPPLFIDFTATQEASVAGSVSGTLADTIANDSAVEIITEQTTGGRRKNRYTYLEHKWIFPVEPGTLVEFFANAWTDAAQHGDTLVFSYSTDDTNYTDMFAVAAAADDDTYQVYELPSNLSGTLFVKVTDTLRRRRVFDTSTLYIDHLFIHIGNEPGTPPPAPGNLAAAGATSSSITLNWTDNSDNETGFYIDRSSDAVNWQQVGSTGAGQTTFTDTGLPAGTTFYYRVSAFNSTGISDSTNIIDAATGNSETGLIHVGALDSWAEPGRRRWKAFASITVHDQDGVPVAGATVSGSWDNGAIINAVTDNNGQCTIVNKRIKSSVPSSLFSVTGLAHAGYIHDPAEDVTGSVLVMQP